MQYRSIFFSLGLLFFFLQSLGAWAGIESALSGTVYDRQGVALPNVRVQLFSSTGSLVQETRSSPTGTYRFFPVTMGDYKISAQAEGFISSDSTLQVASGTQSGIDFHLDPTSSGKEMIVEVKAKKRLVHKNSATSSTELNREQIAKLPQGMETSLPRLLATTTPGVVQGPFGQIFFRGNHANIQYQLDGVQMPDSPSNTFGQTLSPRNIDRMEVITGGIPAEFGQRLSAVVNIVTKSGPEQPGGEIELNYGSYRTTTPHLLFGGSNQSGSLHYFFSANFYRTDRGLDTPQPESYQNQGQGGAESIHNDASGTSEFAKIDWQIDNQNKLSWIASFSQNRFEIPVFPSSFLPTDPFFQRGFTDAFGNGGDPDRPTFNYLPPETNDRQTELNTYAQVIWKHTFSERSFLQLAPYYKYSLIKIENDPENDLASATRLNILGAQPSSFYENRHTNNLGLKGDYTWRLNDEHLLKTGFLLQGSRSDGTVSIRTATLPADGSPLVTDFVEDSSPNTGFFESVYVQDDYTLAKPLVLNLGLRYDATQFILAGQRPTDSMLQPRIGLNYRVTETTQLHTFYGKLFQPAPVENLRYDYNPTTGRFSNLQTYDIKAEKADYYEVGVAQQFLAQQVGMLNLYYKNATNILDDAQIANTSIAQPYNYATGYAYGAELSVRGQLSDDWSEYANYSYTIAKGRGASSVPEEQGDVFLDHTQVHTVNAGVTYAKNYFWWTTQTLYGSGLRTGPYNSIDLPGHLTFDTTVGYEFHGKSWLSQFRISGDVLNILDNRYPITIANGFNGSHYAAGRQFFIRLAKAF